MGDKAAEIALPLAGLAVLGVATGGFGLAAAPLLGAGAAAGGAGAAAAGTAAATAGAAGAVTSGAAVLSPAILAAKGAAAGSAALTGAASAGGLASFLPSFLQNAGPMLGLLMGDPEAKARRQQEELEIARAGRDEAERVARSMATHSVYAAARGQSLREGSGRAVLEGIHGQGQKRLGEIDAQQGISAAAYRSRQRGARIGRAAQLGGGLLSATLDDFRVY